MTERQHFYSPQELFILIEEYYDEHPEKDDKHGAVSGSPAEVYKAGAIDFIQWLANEKQFLYQSDSLLDLTDEEFDEMFLDLEEEENCQRDETY